MQINAPHLDDEAVRIASNAAYSRAATAKQKLARHYYMVMAGALLLPLLSCLLVTILFLPVWVAILYALFGFVMALLNGLFARYLSRCDMMSQPIVTALSLSERIIHWQNNIFLFGFCSGLTLICLLLYYVYAVSDTDILAGALSGLLIGVIIGVRKYRRQRRLARQIRTELRAVLSSHATSKPSSPTSLI